MPQATQSQTSAVSSRKRKIPDYLVKDLIDGVSFYYPGYKQVLNKKKTAEEIMGWSGLQCIIVAYFTELLYNQLNLNQYRLIPGETGNHLGYKNNLSLDIAIFEKSVLTPDKINDKYIDVPAYCVIEVDVQAEWDDTVAMSDMKFIGLKTEKLFQFGTQKLIWVLSQSKKVIVATPGKHWEIIDWTEDIELIEGISFNIGKYLYDEGIIIDPKPDFK